MAEGLGVLRPGGTLAGSDSVPSDRLHHFHDDATYNPVGPGTVLTRLETTGFDRITVSAGDKLKMIADKPADGPGA